MAYVRRRGNQLAIVTGERNPETKQVDQRILFTFFSKPEAFAALGTVKDRGPHFDRLMEHAHPDVKFDWKQIREAIQADLDYLPDAYEYKESRLMGRFKDDLVAFARALMLADPQELVSADAVIKEHRPALEYLRELIDWRLETAGTHKESEWTRDNAFFWRYRLQGKEVPTDVEEFASGLWERRELEKAEGAFGLIASCFPDDPEAWNYLGLIALERKDFAQAEQHFRTCMERGRKILPKRVARSSWWSDLKTRPYMRALRNLTLTLIRTGKYLDASALAHRLDTECADDLTASTFRAVIAMNTGDWTVAAESSARLTGLWPEEGLIEALARYEQGQRFETLAPFIHAAVTHPRATRLVLGLRAKEPTRHMEAEDWNSGVHFIQDLAGYLSRKDRSARKFFEKVLRNDRVARLVGLAEKLRGEWFGHPKAERGIFDELNRVEKKELAVETARAIAPSFGLLPPAEPMPTLRRRGGRAGSATLH